MNKKSKNTASITGTLFMVGVLSLMIFSYTVTRPRFIRIQATLEEELRTLAPPQDTTLLRYHSAHGGYRKSLMAGAIANYNSSLPYETIHQHYKQELQQHGWTFLKKEENDIDIVNIYCKGDYSGIVRYAKNNSPSKWDYVIDLKYKENLILTTLSGCRGIEVPQVSIWK